MSDGFLSDEGWDVTTRPWYKVAEVKKTILAAPYVDVSTNKLIVSAAAPLYDHESGNVIGVVGIDMALDRLNTIMQSYTLGENGFYMLIAADEQIVYHTDNALIQKKVSEIGMSEGILSNIKNKKYAFQEYQIDNKSYYGYLSPVGDTGWHILSGLPAKEFRQTFMNLMLSIIAIFLVGIAVILGFIRLISRAMSKPLQNLPKKRSKLQMVI